MQNNVPFSLVCHSIAEPPRTSNDDLLATGGTMEAVAKMVERLGATIVELAFVVELPPLGGRKRLGKYPVHSDVRFMVD